MRSPVGLFVRETHVARWIAHLAPFRSLRHAAACSLAVMVASVAPAGAQTRERPVPFDDVGRVSTITPPLAARLQLSAPVWPVSGDYLEARLYALDDSAKSFVLVVQRPQGVLERIPADSSRRRLLAEAVARGLASSGVASSADSAPTFISEPVRGGFIARQTFLGLGVFGPLAAAVVQDPAGSTAAYLLVAGGTFFTAANLTSNHSVSRAQNHLAFHSAIRGAIATDLALYAVAGDDVESRAVAGATLAGAIIGDIVGFQLAKPMTDAEAHGTAHGSTVGAALAVSMLGAAGAGENDGSLRPASVAVIAAGALGYPLGLAYVRRAPYRVTAGDVTTLLPAEVLGIGAASLLISDHVSSEVAFGVLGAGFVAGAIAGDRLLVRPFDHTESEGQLVGLGTGAGALIGLIVPVLAHSGSRRGITAAMLAGGILGAVASEQALLPRRAMPGDRGENARRRTGAARDVRRPRVDVSISAEAALMAGLGQRGQHAILSLGF